MAKKPELRKSPEKVKGDWAEHIGSRTLAREWGAEVDWPLKNTVHRLYDMVARLPHGDRRIAVQMKGTEGRDKPGKLTRAYRANHAAFADYLERIPSIRPLSWVLGVLPVYHGRIYVFLPDVVERHFENAEPWLSPDFAIPYKDARAFYALTEEEVAEGKRLWHEFSASRQLGLI